MLLGQNKLAFERLEPCAGKLACTVLRGIGSSNVADLPDKASITKTCSSNIIVGALAFKENIYDGHTLPVVLEQVKALNDLEVSSSFVDRGYRGQSRVNGTAIYYPQAPQKKLSKEIAIYLQKQFRKRAGIEGVISHLKSEHRLARNYLKGFIGDQINLFMAAAAFNFGQWLRAILFWLRSLLMTINFFVSKKILTE